LPVHKVDYVQTLKAALAVHDARILFDTMVAIAAMDVEGFAANTSPYHPALGRHRPYPGYIQVLATMNSLLSEGSAASAAAAGKPRHLQAPLSFRSCAVVLGACSDGLLFVEGVVDVQLNAHQQNPIFLEEEDRMLPCGHFDMQPLASALDFARLSLAPCLTAQVERTIKLLQASQSGLTDGLQPLGDDAATSHGFSSFTFTLQALATEARLLIQPVSAEVGSGSQAEGVEDRVTMASLSARRLTDMVLLMHRCCAISAAVACQAVDLRQAQLAPQLQSVYAKVRSVIRGLHHPGDRPPSTAEMHQLVSIVSTRGLIDGEEPPPTLRARL
jgi:histidine ammonia-lyase